MQVVTFFHTVLLSDSLKFRTALVVCPLNTVLNWVYEFRKWQRNVGSNRVNVCTAVCMKVERFGPSRDTNLAWAGSTSGDSEASLKPSRCAAEMVQRGRGYGNGV